MGSILSKLFLRVCFFHDLVVELFSSLVRLLQIICFLGGSLMCSSVVNFTLCGFRKERRESVRNSTWAKTKRRNNRRVHRSRVIQRLSGWRPTLRGGGKFSGCLSFFSFPALPFS